MQLLGLLAIIDIAADQLEAEKRGGRENPSRPAVRGGGTCGKYFDSGCSPALMAGP